MMTSEAEAKAQAKVEIDILQSQLSFKVTLIAALEYIKWQQESEVQQVQRELASMKRKLDMQKESPKSQPAEVAVAPTTPVSTSVASATECPIMSAPAANLLSVLPLLLQLNQLVATTRAVRLLYTLF